MDSINFPEKKKPLVIYHKNCADGFGAAWCFWNNASREYEYHAASYTEGRPDCANRIIYLVDFSYKKEVVKSICKEAEFVYFIDHHVSAIKDLAPLSDPLSQEYQKNFQAVTAIDSSGAMLAWDFLHNGLAYEEPVSRGSFSYFQPPKLLSYIEDRDLWKFKFTATRDISAALFSYPYDFKVWDTLMFGEHNLEALERDGIAIERKHHKDIKELLAITERKMYICGIEVPVACMPYTMASDAANILATYYAQGRIFAATYYDTAEHRVFSLRSVKDIGVDVSIIADSYGGGGHKNAAGFKVPRSHLLATS